MASMNMRRCMKKFKSKKLCKYVMRRKREGHAAPHSRIKACKMGDRNVRKLIGSMARAIASARSGNGSGAEDRHHYYAQDVKQSIQGRCGRKFAAKAYKNAVKLAY